MRKIYCIEHWVEDTLPYRDGDWTLGNEPWKIGKDPITHYFSDEDAFKTALLNIINHSGVISKVYMKEITDEEFRHIFIEGIPEAIKL